LKSTCGMQERDPKKCSMATEEHALKIRRPWHCQSELSRLSPENVSKSGEQPKAIIRAREDHVNSTRLAPESSGFSCQILPDNRGHDKGDRKDQPACEPPVGYTSSGPNVHRSRTARQPTGAQCWQTRILSRLRRTRASSTLLLTRERRNQSGWYDGAMISEHGVDQNRTGREEVTSISGLDGAIDCPNGDVNRLHLIDGVNRELAESKKPPCSSAAEY
jgi:hypothetical protein